ncbi:hypothetical protein V8F33_010258 [Rhypophila sp. PSN 637]
MGEYTNLRPVAAKAGPELEIHLDRPPVTVPDQPMFFHPGETVTGFISRKQHIVAPRGTITIAVIGRSAAVYTKRRKSGNNTTTRHYHSKFVLFEQTQQVFDGPVHIPANASEPHTWPFSLTLPIHPSTSTSNIQQKHAERSFLPLDPQTICATVLPGSFQFHSGHSHDEVDAWVEYYLEATLTEEHEGTSFFGGRKSPKIKHARAPIPLSTAPTPHLLDHRMLRHKMPGQCIYSQRLLPGRGTESKLSTREHLSKLFHTSSVPRYTFSVELEFPTVLQFGNSIPLGIRVVPDPRNITESIAQVEQAVRLVNLKLRITRQVETKIDYEDGWNTGGYRKDGKVYLEIDFTQPWEKETVGGDIIIPAPPVAVQGATGSGKEALIEDPSTEDDGAGPSSSPPTYTASTPAMNFKGGKGVQEKSGIRAGTGLENIDAVARPDVGGPGPSMNPNHIIYLYKPGDTSTVPFLNLGERIKLQLARDCMPRLGGKKQGWGENELAPDFVSYNITLAHLLKCEVTLEVVGEKVKVSAEHGVQLVPGWN